jgi:hypothetical protein
MDEDNERLGRLAMMDIVKGLFGTNGRFNGEFVSEQSPRRQVSECVDYGSVDED